MKKMNFKTVLFTLLVIFTACSDNATDKTPFEDYQVEDITNLDINSIKKTIVLSQSNENNTESNKVAFYGLKNNRIWLAIFDKFSKELLTEYCFANEIPHSINLPYGEHFDVKDWQMSFYEYGNLIVTDGSYSNIKIIENTAISSDSFCSFSSPAFINNTFISLVNGIRYPFWCGDSHILTVNDGYLLVMNNGNNVFLKEAPYSGSDYSQIPITHTLTFHNALYIIYIQDLITGNKVEVNITELEDLVKNKETDWGHITLTPKSVIEEKYVEVSCNITFKSGTKKTFGIVIDLTNKEYTWTEC